MPDPRYILRRIRALGVRESARRALGVARRVRAAKRVRSVDSSRSTYSEMTPKGSIASYMRSLDIAVPAWLAEVCEEFLGHRFDLLGSGWVGVRYGMSASGVEGNSYPADSRASDPASLAARQARGNRSESARIRAMLSSAYEPIDWHIDFKSGFRWSEDTWYRDITYGELLGVDVKVPWELARAQHLPLLALAYIEAGKDVPVLHFRAPERYAAEFRDQVLDFVSANPPRFGVNWTCTMDVAIRCSNWLIARDLFVAAGHEFDPEFEQVFARSIQDHARHIIGNLEWSDDIRGNHYLADIVGLLFAAAYLPSSPETDAWLAFATRELLGESVLQFWQDGSNFEASTAYHRLSSEMLLWGVALLSGLPQERRRAFEAFDHTLLSVPVEMAPAPLEVYPLANEIIERLNRGAEFALGVVRPDKRIVQIGDNDSGRFFKFGATYRAHQGALTEDHLDFAPLLSIYAGLLGREELWPFTAEERLEGVLVATMCNGGLNTHVERVAFPSRDVRICQAEELEAAGNVRSRRPSSELRQEYPAPSGVSLREGLETFGFPEFGLYIMRSDRLWLSVRCGPIGQNNNGGHAHNDQLSLELFIDGQPLLVDPGTYVYTPLPDRRNEYRSVRAHAAPQVDGREPGSMIDGLFRLGNEAQARCLRFDDRGFTGVHMGYGPPVWREIEVLDDRIRVTDWIDSDRMRLSAHRDALPFSPGYGIIERGGVS